MKINKIFKWQVVIINVWILNNVWAGIYMGTDAAAPLQYLPTPLPHLIQIGDYQRTPIRYPLGAQACHLPKEHSQLLDKFGNPIPADFMR